MAGEVCLEVSRFGRLASICFVQTRSALSARISTICTPSRDCPDKRRNFWLGIKLDQKTRGTSANTTQHNHILTTSHHP